MQYVKGGVMSAYAFESRGGCFGERVLWMGGRHGRRRQGRREFPGFFGRGMRAGRGDIRAAILALLREQPMHGYQIMQELSERSGGVWRPSPGSVYPTLAQMQDEGLVRSEDGEGGRRIFQLTGEGRKLADGAAEEQAPWDAVAGGGDSAEIGLRDLIGGVILAARQVVHAGDRHDIEQAQEILRDARKRLYQLLAGEGERPPE
jgi:DNA-binding PadR family transcriptional regulator